MAQYSIRHHCTRSYCIDENIENLIVKSIIWTSLLLSFQLIGIDKVLENIEEMWRNAFEMKSMEPIQLDGLVSFISFNFSSCTVQSNLEELYQQADWPGT